MKASHSFMLLSLATLVALAVVCLADHVFIKPTRGLSEPPQISKKDDYLTLSQHISANTTSLFSTSNSTLEFLPGTHEVTSEGNKKVFIRNVSNIVWQGSSTQVTSVIKCKGRIVFIFADIVNLTIITLEFCNCGGEVPTTPSQQVIDDDLRKLGEMFLEEMHFKVLNISKGTSAAVVAANVFSLVLENVIIQHSLGIGLLGVNTLGDSQINSCLFIGNTNSKLPDELCVRKCYTSSCDSTEDRKPIRCPGANAIFIFLDSINTLVQNQMHSLTISGSCFNEGKDVSKPEQNPKQCTHRSQCQLDSTQMPRANGLAVVAAQNMYQIKCVVKNTTFSKNTWNHKYPAVVISDHGSVLNQFRVIDSTFIDDGTFSVEIQPLDLSSTSNVLSNVKVPFIIIQRCTFSSGDTTGLEVHLHLKEENITNTKRQVVIKDCLFCNFSESSSSVLLVHTHTKYNRSLTSDYCPNSLFSPITTIKIINCSFAFNKMTSTALFFDNNEANLIEQKKLETDRDQDVCENLFSYGPEYQSGRYRSWSIFHSFPFCNWFRPLQIANDNTPSCKHSIKVSERTISLDRCNFTDNDTPNHPTFIIKGSDTHFIENHEALMNFFHVETSAVKIQYTMFTRNVAKQTGALRLETSYVSLKNCELTDNDGTALYLDKSVVTLQGTNTFSYNHGTFGGAICLIRSRLYLKLNSSTIINGNSAKFGGGIYATSISTFTAVSNVLCTLSFPPELLSTGIRLENNTAEVTGDSIFGGAYNNCYYVSNYTKIGRNYGPGVYLSLCSSNYSGKIEITNQRTISTVSSPPTRFCICPDMNIISYDNCGKTKTTQVSVFPGQKFNISVIAIGDLNGSYPVVVSSSICDANSYSQHRTCKYDYDDIGRGQKRQKLENNCKNLTYSLHSLKKEVELQIKIDKGLTKTPTYKYSHNIEDDIILIVAANLLPCPPGFTMSNENEETMYCKCREFLHKFGPGVECSIEEGLIRKPAEKWIGIESDVLVVHNHCPFDYCKQGTHTMYINLSNPSEQCNYDRSGLLCGECKLKGVSVILGSSKCRKCSNIFLLLLLPFILAGPVLVALLLKCNITVSTGQINALIFYANIVQVNRALFLPDDGIASAILSVPIAWINLDLGIDTCFFDSMDMYTKVALQFIFPVYLWVLIGLIILVARYLARASKVIGENAVSVLATLFIFSYAKLLRTIILAVSFTYLEYENGTHTLVWLPDASVPMFSIKHSFLFAVAFVFTIGYVVPLTVLVLFAPCLQTRSHYKVLHWVNRLKPFLDSFQGPYNNNFRWWTGLMLLLRVLLFLVFASNHRGDSALNLVWIVLITGPCGVFVLSKFNRGIYKNVFTNLLEAFLLLNVALLSLLIVYLNHSSYIQQPFVQYASYVSISTTLLVFVSILLYKLSNKLCPKLFVVRRRHHNETVDDHAIPMTVQTNDSEAVIPTHSIVSVVQDENLLREPLLES